jgi:cyanophycin synthetase
MGVKNENITAALTTFFPSFAQTPGRLTMMDMGNFKVLVDFAHNVAGYEGLAEFVKSLNPGRTIVTLCLPGDRRMEDFEEVSRIAAETYDEVILFEGYERGQEKGYISSTLQKYLIKHGMDNSNIEIIIDENQAVQHSLDHAQEGDLIILSNYDITGIHKRLVEHKEKLEKEAAKGVKRESRLY